MIQTPRQYYQARRQLSRWTALKRRLTKMAADFAIDDRELTAFIDARIDSISKSLSDYQTLQCTDFEDTEILRQMVKFPTSLIRARIAFSRISC